MKSTAATTRTNRPQGFYTPAQTWPAEYRALQHELTALQDARERWFRSRKPERRAMLLQYDERIAQQQRRMAKVRQLSRME